MDQNTIKAIYKELKGYLSQTPIPANAYETANQVSLWSRVNQAIDELNLTTGKDYSRFKVTPLNEGNGEYIVLSDLRSALGGITSKLHAEYFSTEDEPFGSKPAMNIVQSQNQSQYQEMYLQMIVDFATLVGQKLNDPQIKPEEKTFLEQVKSGLSKAKSGLDLVNLILDTGATLGLTAVQIASLFK